MSKLRLPPERNEALPLWYVRSLVRLSMMMGMYLLGVIAVWSIQASRSSFSILSLATLLVLPFGVEDGLVHMFPAVRTFLYDHPSADTLSLLIGPVLFLILTVGILLARSRGMLILSYLGYSLIVLVAVQGCSGPILGI